MKKYLDSIILIIFTLLTLLSELALYNVTEMSCKIIALSILIVSVIGMILTSCYMSNKDS